MADEVQSILVIDDHPLMRKGILQLIAMAPDLRLAGEAGDGVSGLKMACQLLPDLILLDLNMHGLSGMDTLKALKAADLDARVIILTISDSEEDVVEALRLGADGYLLKDMEPEDVLHALQVAASGQIALSERVASILAAALRHENQAKSPVSIKLTEREQAILSLIATGYSNKLIARKLKITEGTVKVHVKHLLRKLDLSSRVEAAVWAIKNQDFSKGHFEG
ncbi:nitrate/nitrite response regulator protein [Candidatus Competibacter denitrificans Run_A_D11]|uniref:Nitrate/nitrite response regulator protein n=1 Tax=Candidatus Competibacter denitrificans Run_A_D11 TaxID=1400863 RepID=W6MB77_9GAMM|nr:two-component system response regulator NarL [Candidatus Competibacter denitrificans]CDI03360.1 nitrate/nitrite response regulator protein [Candidatus Competibacter denitrificans Run_A_D11]HAS87039.1 two-component system response regulator NarL [Candidatus Competibacteraceae bacterium]HRC68967.1 two-component system response regulator NarL [Candidatus Competibacter denitrificans]